jgi:hypothetical protein
MPLARSWSDPVRAMRHQQPQSRLLKVRDTQFGQEASLRLPGMSALVSSKWFHPTSTPAVALLAASRPHKMRHHFLLFISVFNLFLLWIWNVVQLVSKKKERPPLGD